MEVEKNKNEIKQNLNSKNISWDIEVDNIQVGNQLKKILK